MKLKTRRLLWILMNAKYFYVGITRAQNALMLSYSDSSLNGKKQSISKYLKDHEIVTKGNITTTKKNRKFDSNSLLLSFS